jgi:hypothetical protein
LTGLSVAKLAQYFRNLCAKEDIHVEWCRRQMQAVRSRGEMEFVRIAPIKCVISYAVALHEVRHIKGRYQQSPRVVVRERWAWDWARRNAIIWTPPWSATRARRWHGTRRER